MKSFSLLRTNVALTTNVKLLVDSKYNLYLESIESADELAASRLKKYQFNKDNFYDELVPDFFKNFPPDIAFSVNYDNDNDNMSNDYANQYDETYVAGAKNIIDNKNYTEEYEYFAPLYVFKHHLPKYFVIFRIDGPGLLDMNKDNFRDEFLNNFKCVKLFDMTRETVLGEFIDRNFKNNISYPPTGLDVDFRELEFTKWIGIDYESGGYTQKSLYFDEELQRESTLFDMEQLITDGYRVNKVIHPNIINFTFLFDDTPATKDTLRKWSLNRYSGFYLDDMQIYDKIHPFKLPRLQSDVVILPGNEIISTSKTDPFVEGFKSDDTMWVEYDGEFYRVERFEKTLARKVNPEKRGARNKQITVDEVVSPKVTRYRIISDRDLSGQQALLNRQHCYIDDMNRIIDASTDSAYVIPDFDYADVNLILIDGIYHNIVFDSGFYRLNTDYGFTYSEDYRLTYFTNSGIDGFSKFIDLDITTLNQPVNFPIFRLKFTDIKDFDTSIIDTEFSKFEYEKRNDITKTEEPKLYFTDLRSNSNPAPFDDFTFKGRTELMPVASEYTANLETFREEDGQLTELWRKSPNHVRWGYQNSLSAHDHQYLLNNTDLLGNFNQTVDTRNFIPNRASRNLDYFYTINSGTTSYIHHTLHVEKNVAPFIQDQNYRFELDKYLNLATYSYFGLTYSYDFNYFEHFFSPTQSFMDGEIVRNVKKWSYFEEGDRAIPSMTVFKGIKFKIFEVDSIIKNNVSVENLNLFTSNKFNDYKFSILLSSNDKMVANDGTLYEPYITDSFISATDLGGGVTSFLTSVSATPSVALDDIIEVEFPQYQTNFATVNYVGPVAGGFGFNAVTNVSGSQNFGGNYRVKLQWKRIFNFELDREYKVGDIVIWNYQTFECTSDVTLIQPADNPANNLSFTTFTTTPTQVHPFWQGTSNSYSPNKWVYIYDEYYQSNSNILSGYVANNFWDDQLTYTQNQVVLYKNRYYRANTATVPVGTPPVVSNRKISVNFDGIKYWEEISQSQVTNPIWQRIPLWNVNENITSPLTYRVYNNVLYLNNSQPLTGEDVPGESTLWDRVYSFEPDTDYTYESYDNPIINIDGWFYLNTFNPGQNYTGGETNPDADLTLDSGITIYIHKPFKNVFVNIAINDNTLQAIEDVINETKNIERDQLYVKPNKRLTAANFIRQINDLDTKYGFADYTSYVVIDDDFTVSKYKFDHQLERLPYLLIAEEADELSIDESSLRFERQDIPKNVLKSKRYLEDGKIDNLEKLNFYNENPISYQIDQVKDQVTPVTNYNSLSNNIQKSIFRHSGYYMPLVYEVELFRNISFYDSLDCSDICPVITWNWNHQYDSNLFYGVSYSTTPIPLFYIGEDDTQRPRYRGVLSNNSGESFNVDLNFNQSEWQLSWIAGTNSITLMSSDSLFGTYSYIDGSGFTSLDFYDSQVECGDFSDTYYVTQEVGTFSYQFAAYASYDGTNFPVTYLISIDNLGFGFSQSFSLWEAVLVGCQFDLSGTYSQLTEGTSSQCGGTVSISQGIDPSDFGINAIDPCIYTKVERSGNWLFDTDLSLFGVKRQRVIQKVNSIDNVLKLRNNESFSSIYPMLDEFGYMVVDFFIFKSTWDYLYHYKTNDPKISSVPSQQNIFRTLYLQQIIKNYNTI